MYQITPYDLSKSFKIIPDKKKYILTFYSGNSIEFSSKRKAFDFIGKISHVFVEVLAICEMTNNTINSYSFHIKPKSKSVKDVFNIYYDNYHSIIDLLNKLKYYQSIKIELYQLIKLFDSLLFLLIDNCKILNTKNHNCVLPYLIIIEKTSNSLSEIVKNAHNYYDAKRLSIFI